MLRRTLLAITIFALSACGGLSQEGGKDRLANLIKYTSPRHLGPDFYDDQHYDGANPRTELLDELNKRRQR
jgi:hypothetical protein